MDNNKWYGAKEVAAENYRKEESLSSMLERFFIKCYRLNLGTFPIITM